ncbi:hypothetical protein FIBSPDRAFT_853288 [Athelia psychrophila]|uniref:Uncharacterized protein n=1 Tax=Athelia psychrophila TaxID=1759441 RepID=A0A166QYM4_9AGAM|nr:hypothetical protein FIBSPDRAFT_853284 [Fibularhizoctonia sp. CBS 109695]KZP27704.1 hypothetical protein FIBSPDRAFT_853288 [Fibularhizoctonia sp. CBS 109695]
MDPTAARTAMVPMIMGWGVRMGLGMGDAPAGTTTTSSLATATGYTPQNQRPSSLPPVTRIKSKP